MKKYRYIILFAVLCIVAQVLFVIYSLYSSHNNMRNFKFLGDTLTPQSKEERKTSDKIFRELKKKVDNEKAKDSTTRKQENR